MLHLQCPEGRFAANSPEITPTTPNSHMMHRNEQGELSTAWGETSASICFTQQKPPLQWRADWTATVMDTRTGKGDPQWKARRLYVTSKQLPDCLALSSWPTHSLGAGTRSGRSSWRGGPVCLLWHCNPWPVLQGLFQCCPCTT